MKLNKTFALVALVTGGMLVGGALSAQETPKEKPAAPQGVAGAPGAPGMGGMRGTMNPEKMAKDLGLNEEKTKKLKAALDERRTKMTDLRADNSMSQEDKRAKNKEIRDATNVKIKAFLSTEEYDKYIKMTPGPRNRPAPDAAAEKPADKPAAKPAADPAKQK